MFSYNNCNGTNNQIDYIRLLISDTVNLNHIFEDEEIQGAYQIQQQMGYQSGMFYSGALTTPLPSTPVSYFRVAALLLDALAANKSRLASIKKLLDVQLDSSDAAIQLRATAADYRDQDDNSGAFAIVEMVQDVFSFRDRFWATVQRETAQ